VALTRRRRCRPAPDVIQQVRRPISDSRELLIESPAVQPAVGPGLHGADDSPELLCERDEALLHRVRGWGG